MTHAPPDPPTETINGGAVFSLRFLLVEDSPLILGFLLDMFRSEGFVAAITTAASEQEAQQLLSEMPPFDVAIVDIQLAQGTGFEVIKALRRSESERAFVIVLTNYAVPVYREVAYGAGADEFLDKSKDFHKIPELIRQRFG